MFLKCVHAHSLSYKCNIPANITGCVCVCVCVCVPANVAVFLNSTSIMGRMTVVLLCVHSVNEAIGRVGYVLFIN